MTTEPIDLRKIYTEEFENMSQIVEPVTEIRNIIYYLIDRGFPITADDIREPEEVIRLIPNLKVNEFDQIPPELFAASLLVLEKLFLYSNESRVVTDVLADVIIDKTSFGDPINTVEILINEKIQRLADYLNNDNLWLSIDIFLTIATGRLIEELLSDEKVPSFSSIDTKVLNGITSSADRHSMFARINILLTKSLEPNVRLENFLNMISQ